MHSLMCISAFFHPGYPMKPCLESKGYHNDGRFMLHTCKAGDTPFSGLSTLEALPGAGGPGEEKQKT